MEVHLSRNARTASMSVDVMSAAYAGSAATVRSAPAAISLTLYTLCGDRASATA
jgi:hypothetical protein